VAAHPANFATFTAPGFGTVHTRHVERHRCTDKTRCDCRPDPCHARRDTGLCEHGQPAVCFVRHTADDPRLGVPLCLDCYDYDHHVVWNLFAGALWHRTKQAIERYLARLARRRGIPFVEVTSAGGKPRSIPPVRVSHGKVAEMQRRGAVHFHALIRLDGVNPDDPDAIVPPPAGFTATDLDNAIRAAAAHTAIGTPARPDRPDGWRVGWGTQVVPRPITLAGRGEITDGMVAGYLAKYATKSTETTGHSSTRITAETIDTWADPDTHTGRLIDACWHLGRPDPTLTSEERAEQPYRRLRAWAHMLGFGGHFLTKARRYSVTFATLRDTRIMFRRTQDQGVEPAPVDRVDLDTVRVVATLAFAGTGWHTLGDALLANTSAALARARHSAGREELAHEHATQLAAQLSNVA
jgi:hypothetical protein